MRYLLAIVLLSVAVQAQSFTSNSDRELPDAPSQKPFWTTGNKVDVTILAGLVTADAITTQRGLNQGLREANPLMRPFVTNGAVGEAVGSALGFGAALAPSICCTKRITTELNGSRCVSWSLLKAGSSPTT